MAQVSRARLVMLMPLRLTPRPPTASLSVPGYENFRPPPVFERAISSKTERGLRRFDYDAYLQHEIDKKKNDK